MKKYTYLPRLSVDALSRGIFLDDWGGIETELGDQCYERMGLERSLLLALDIWEECGSLNGVRVLDVGCNNGLFAQTLAMLGCHVIGIDSGVIDHQGLYHQAIIAEDCSGEPLLFRFQQIDLLEYLRAEKDIWDYVLLLSVAHHWETGYAMSGKRVYSNDDVQFIMDSLCERTRRAIYYECPSSEPGFDVGAGVQFLDRYLRCSHSTTPLGKSIGPNGYLRDLLKIQVG